MDKTSLDFSFLNIKHDLKHVKIVWLLATVFDVRSGSRSWFHDPTPHSFRLWHRVGFYDILQSSFFMLHEGHFFFLEIFTLMIGRVWILISINHMGVDSTLFIKWCMSCKLLHFSKGTLFARWLIWLPSIYWWQNNVARNSKYRVTSMINVHLPGTWCNNFFTGLRLQFQNSKLSGMFFRWTIVFNVKIPPQIMWLSSMQCDNVSFCVPTPPEQKKKQQYYRGKIPMKTGIRT